MRPLGLAAVPILIVASAEMAFGAAIIDLGRDPEPPTCVENPNGGLDITWQIHPMTDPAYVLYEIIDSTRTVILDTEIYPGTTGLAVSRAWSVPRGTPGGKYWVRVEYWSVQAGNEANSEVAFFICTDLNPTPTQQSSWGRLKSTYR